MKRAPYDIEITDALLVTVQFMYLTRKPLRVRECFFDKLYENIRRCGFGQKDEDELLAMALAASGKKGNHSARVGICCRALELVGDRVEHGMHTEDA